jgi:excisionase family DNA binding protein
MMTPEERLLRAFDELRDAMAAFLADRAAPAEPPALLTLTHAAERLGVSRSTVTRWADEGRLRTVGVPNGRRVPRAELEAIATGRGDAA